MPGTHWEAYIDWLAWELFNVSPDKLEEVAEGDLGCPATRHQISG